jgi:hypothetical protein
LLTHNLQTAALVRGRTGVPLGRDQQAPYLRSAAAVPFKQASRRPKGADAHQAEL